METTDEKQKEAFVNIGLRYVYNHSVSYISAYFYSYYNNNSKVLIYTGYNSKSFELYKVLWEHYGYNPKSFLGYTGYCGDII